VKSPGPAVRLVSSEGLDPSPSSGSGALIRTGLHAWCHGKINDSREISPISSPRLLPHRDAPPHDTPQPR
jgi:hypothetical protein